MKRVPYAREFAWPQKRFCFWLGLMLFLAAVASIILARRATWIAVREALVYE